MSDAAPSEHLIWCCSRCRAIFRKEAAFCPSDGGEIEAASHDPLIGTDLDHYTIEALLGEGGMGRVYRAHHKTLVEKVFAVKVLIGDLAAAQAMRMRFVNEAKNAGRLAHRNIASVVDFGRSSGGLIYLVMELVDGLPLSTIIDEGPLDPERVARLGRGIAEGLRHAHQLGIVHRDLKPENVIVKRDETGEVPMIVDFGIALSIDRSDARLTATGIALGTPGYVAPEQVSGNELDARADQYSLGVTLYEALTGGLPFIGDPVAVISAKIGHDAPPIAERMPDARVAPPGLARIIEKMVARQRRQRFDDLDEVIEALDRWIDHRGGDTDVVPMRARRRRIGTVVALGAAVAMAATTVAWTLTRTPEPAAAQRSTAIGAPAHAVAPALAAPGPPAIAASAIEAAPIVPTKTDPVVAVAPKVAHVERPTRRPSRPRPSRTASTSGAAARAPAPPAPLPPPQQVADPTPPPISAPPPAAKPPVPLQARLLGVDVQGSLSQAVIQRAVERVRPVLERCTSEGAPYTLRVQFTIDESRRAHGVRGSASTAAMSCVVSALGAVRTEAAPDTGDAEVVVRIAFGTRS